MNKDILTMNTTVSSSLDAMCWPVSHLYTDENICWYADGEAYEHIQLDFREYTVQGLKLVLCGDFGARFSAYKVNVSEDGKNWKVLQKFDELKSSPLAEVELILDEPVTGEFIRLVPVGPVANKSYKWGLQRLKPII